ncbi:MAG: putative phage abortive infection protein [Chitinophagales bacterium]|nr:putative phage abortive infection protein [Chitinophagales bacterium]
MTLEEEIQSATDRIETRTTEFETKISKLETKIKTYSNWAWGFVIGGFVVVIVGLILYLCRDNTNYNLNLLGDFYGGSVASIWSLAGLFFIYIAFLGQKQQLLNQQMEIMYSQLEVKYTRLELEGQKKEMIEQNQTLRQQRFDNTFFQLLNTHSNIVSSMDLRKYSEKSSVISEGRDCFDIFYQRLEIYIKTQNNSKIKIDPKSANLDDTFKGYDLFFEKNQNNLGHYFRNLYHIIKYIDKSEIENKKTYTNFVRAQLSSHELALIFYNCLTEYGNDKFKPLIEKYSLLKNMNKGLVFNSNHLTEYDTKAYGK